MDREQEIQFQFLDEAQEYVRILESQLLGIGQGIDIDRVNAALRAAHSIKGGAGMMGYVLLSELAHRLEDSLKVLKIQKHSITVDPDLEHLLLNAVDRLRQVADLDRQGQTPDPIWLEQQVSPLFMGLYERLGEPEAEDAYSILSPEESQDVVPLLFQTEVEESLAQFGELLEQSIQQSCHQPDQQLAERLANLSDELGGLGEMLQLPAFTQLCASVRTHLSAAPDRVLEIAQAALQSWRRSQALVLTGYRSELPNCLNLTGFDVADFDVADFDVADFDVAGFKISGPNLPTPVLTDVEVDQNGVSQVGFDQFGFDQFGFSQTDFDQSDAVESTSDLEPDDLTLHPITPLAPPTYRPHLPVEANLSDAKLNGDVAETTVRVPVKQLDRLNDLFGELTIERNGLDLNLKRLRSLMRTLTQRIQVLESSNTQLRDVYDKVATQRPDSQRPGLTGSTSPIPVQVAPRAAAPLASSNLDRLDARFDVLELDRYDDVHLLSQEVMETVVQIQEVASDLEFGLDEAEQTARELNKTARQLQTRITQVRMRPLSDVTERFPRALRELSLQYGKPVRLQVEGANTLIDRNILDALNEPLLHLVRNAFDHGIEPPELRQVRNKPAQGTITIRATHHQNRTLITIHDDGGGIPLDRVRQRARQMGLDEVLLAAASDEEVLSLIFEPGFSTSEQVTRLSGRGVGMDVVRERLKQVQGEITVDTQAGVGTTFTLSVPFTLSVMRVLLIECSGLLMAFPTSAIQEMIMLAPEQILTTAGSEAFTWHGTMVQLVRLRQWLRFNCPRSLESPEGRAAVRVSTVLLLPQGSQTVGLEVDRCWGEQEVAIRKIQGGPDLPAGFSNCTILGDGRVVPLVSVPDLLRWLISCQRDKTEQPEAVPTGPTAPANWRPIQLVSTGRSPAALLRKPASSNRTVLIVDDSINVRRFLALTLEKAGYRVIQAKDGQEALDKLGDVNVQAVVCDIEMPRLDGYGFLARLKANPTYEQLPVAMLTTRSSDKHRQLALSLGATAYFSKPFNEQALLQTLEKMVLA